MAGDKVFFRSLTTLILDDSEGMQRLLGEMLAGCVRSRVVTCRSLDRAEAALNSDAFDLALVDRELGDHDGLDFVRHIRSRRGLHQHIPIVVLSVNASRETLLEALMSGAHSVLRKPVSQRDLNAHVRRALSEQRVFVPFTSHVVPLTRSMAWQLGTNPEPTTVIEAIAATVARTTAGQDFEDSVAPAGSGVPDAFSLI
jgi:DNA-binding response OmpR family regulator